MTDLDPCLAGCDDALCEAERMLAVLGATGTDEAALAPVRQSVARLRREVGRLRGIKMPRVRNETDPMWMEMIAGQSPWTSAKAANSDPL